MHEAAADVHPVFANLQHHVGRELAAAQLETQGVRYLGLAELHLPLGVRKGLFDGVFLVTGGQQALHIPDQPDCRPDAVDARFQENQTINWVHLLPDALPSAAQAYG